MKSLDAEERSIDITKIITKIHAGGEKSSKRGELEILWTEK